MKKLIILLAIILSTFTFAIEKNYKYKKIISMSMASDELLYALVSKDRILALSDNSDKNEMRSALWNKINDFNQVKDNVEQIMALEPDLVIVPNWIKKTVISQLEDAGINIYVYDTPSNFQEEKNLIKELSCLLEVKNIGARIIKDMDTRLLAIQQKIKKSGKPCPRVLEYSHYGSTNGKGSMFDDMLSNIYCKNVASEIGIYRFAKISKELVIDLNPEIILIPIWDSTSAKNCSKFFTFIKNDKSLAEVDAIKNNKVYAIPGKYVYMYSQYIIDGMEEIANSIYELK
ncbi:ABC transporter substrate-binding protein [uncultured Fusobacterium sp.]|jgi:iron complex transport system substrate-binding protein|uniref:ABC transporter substrate-binding protein n=1 Tax=uncultured Fusobacterium sp. TaxID=159267 RepID=UPI00258E853D|nr:ABC transporter substrate-binding protein [uncultured Fusobacterium sp.]